MVVTRGAGFARIGSLIGVLATVAIAIGTALSRPADAALINTVVEVEVTAVDSGVTAVAVGDRFTLDFTVQDSTVDGGAGVGFGSFPDLVTGFTMTAAPGNAGTWTPSGVFDLGAASNFVTNAFGDNMTFQLRGSGFPDSGTGLPFFDVSFSLGWPSDLTDSGLGDTFAQQLLPLAFGIPPATLSNGEIRFSPVGNVDYFNATFEIVSGPPVPTATPLAMLMLAIALIGLGWRLQRSQGGRC